MNFDNNSEEFKYYNNDINEYKDYELMNLGNYFQLKKENPKDKLYIDYEENLNNLLDSRLSYLYNMFKPYIYSDDLKIFSDENFIKLCRYFLEIHKKDKLFNDDNLCLSENKFIIFQFVINLIYFVDYNVYYNYNIYDYNYNIINPIITLNSFNKITNMKLIEKYEINDKFKILSEKIVLFISLTNSKYNMPFDIIIYMILGTPKFNHLFY